MVAKDLVVSSSYDGRVRFWCLEPPGAGQETRCETFASAPLCLCADESNGVFVGLEVGSPAHITSKYR